MRVTEPRSQWRRHVTLSPAPDNDIAYASLIQTYAADAWYHKKLSAELQQRPLKQVVDDARTFAFGDYMLALTKGNTLSSAEYKTMAQKLSRSRTAAWVRLRSPG